MVDKVVQAIHKTFADSVRAGSPKWSQYVPATWSARPYLFLVERLSLEGGGRIPYQVNSKTQRLDLAWSEPETASLQLRHWLVTGTPIVWLN